MMAEKVTGKEFRATHRAEYREYNRIRHKIWTHANSKHVVEYQEAWNLKHPDYWKDWRANHPNYWRERRARNG